MPRRPAKVTQADLARAIRAAEEAGATVSVDADGVIRNALTSSAVPTKPTRKCRRMTSPKRIGKLGMSGMDKMIAFDQSQSLDS